MTCHSTLGSVSSSYASQMCAASGTFTKSPSGEIQNHNRYTFLPLYFVAIAVIAWIPTVFWRYMEGGLIESLIPKEKSLLDWKSTASFISSVISYMKRTVGKNYHQSYAFSFVITDVLSLVTTIVIIVCIDSCIGNFAFGNPSFPIKASCVLELYGMSGTGQSVDAICVLSANAFIGVILAIIWYFLLFSLVFALLCFAISIAGLHSVVRQRVLEHINKKKNSPLQVYWLSERLDYADWLIVTSVCKSQFPVVAAMLIKQLITKLQKKDENTFSSFDKTYEKTLPERPLKDEECDPNKDCP